MCYHLHRMITSFEPIADVSARVLILGTLPSAASLAAGHNYGHPRNAFWYIMQTLMQRSQEDILAAIASGDLGGLLTIDPAVLLDFETRKKLLIQNRIALWDSLRSAAREGSSLDSAIDVATEIPNDIPGFLRTHPQVRAIFFNGAKSESVFKRLIAPLISADPELAVGADLSAGRKAGRPDQPGQSGQPGAVGEQSSSSELSADWKVRRPGPCEEQSVGLQPAPLIYRRLPSTSPANAGMPLVEKLAAWNAIMLTLNEDQNG